MPSRLMGMSMKRVLPFLLIGLFFLVGASLVVYPLISNTLYEQNQSHVLAEYDEAVAQTEQDALEAALEQARSYNDSLVDSWALLTDPFDPDAIQDPTVEPYASLLNLAGDGMMGYIEIPKIGVYLPIYHGTTSEVLEEGVGHLQSTSLPVGGSSTHAVLTGHTGLSGKRLFTDLTEMDLADVFYLHVMNETLAYQVERIDIVEPEDTELLVIRKGADLVTLVTCYPYGINTQRLLVQGTRIPYEQAIEQQQRQEDSGETVESRWQIEYRKAIILCVLIYIPLTIIILLLLFLSKRKKQKKS